MPHALIVDDLPESLRLLRSLLEFHQWTVDEAGDGAAAVVRLEERKPDVIVSDLRMPGMDGFALLRHCKADPRFRTVPFAVFSGTFTSPADRDLVLRLQADAFILKSEPSAEVLRRILSLAPPPGTAKEPGVSPPPLDTDYASALARKLDTKYFELELALKTARDNEARTHQILDALPAAAYTCDAAGLIGYANRRAHALWGCPPRPRDDAERMLGPCRHLDPGTLEPIAPAASGIALALRGVDVPAREIQLQRADGTCCPVLAHASPLRDTTGTIMGAVAILVDLSGQEDARIALRDSQARLQGIVQSAMDAIVSVDAQHRIVLFNPAAERMFDRPAATMLGQPLDLLLPSAHRASHARHIETFGRSGFTSRSMGSLGTVFGLRRSGEQFPIEASISQTTVNGERLFTVVLREITGRIRAEQTLRESEERFRQVTENIDEVFWLFEVAARRTIYVSPAFERVWGFPPQVLYDREEQWIGSVHPDDAPAVRAFLESLVAGNAASLEYRIRRPDRTERWVRDRGFPIRHADGTVFRVAGVTIDITRERSLEERVRQSQKMEAVGQLAGGIAHDFNNLLTVIQMHGSLLARRADPGIEESLRPMLDAAARAANLTRQLLTFSRRQVRDLRPVDFAELVSTMIRLLRRVMGEDIEVETAMPASLPLVQADAGMLEQVVMNLAVNARDAMPRGGRLRVALDTLVVGPDQLVPHPEAKPGEFVRLSVHDSGCGIAPEDLPHIFEPFFTTKSDGHGTGLGLAMVFGIAQQHGGWVDVESAIGSGSTFHVILPALPSSARPTGTTRSGMAPVLGGSGRILLVEDELAVRAVARRVLTQLGYEVVEAASAHDALVAFREAKQPFRLLLTDLIMPGGITGQELATMLSAEQPDLRVIYMSGYSDEIVNRRLTVVPGENFLAKPFEIEALSRIVRRTLDRAPAPP